MYGGYQIHPPSSGGVTDDLSIDRPEGVSTNEIVRFVIDRALAGDEDLAAALQERFGLSEADADLARDRTLGGIVRAATGDPANEPRSGRDPVAATSYRLALEDPSIIARLRPSLVRPEQRSSSRPGPRRKRYAFSDSPIVTTVIFVLLAMIAVLLFAATR